MNQLLRTPILIALGVILVGAVSLVILRLELSVGPLSGLRGSSAQAIAQPTRGRELPTMVVFEPPTPTIQATKVTPSATARPVLAPLALPEVPVPADGQLYALQPLAPEDVGWVRTNDEVANHLGDYSILAGTYAGDVHIGALQIDLSAVPPGSPIIYADLTITGLSENYSGEPATWAVDLLQPWLSEQWTENNFHWLQRADSVAAPLPPLLDPVTPAFGEANTFVFTPDALTLLQARLFAGKAAFRLTGPNQGEDNLFAWDGGFGTGSLGRGPILRIIAGPSPAEPPPSPTPALVIMTPLPKDEQLLALAAERLAATTQAVPYTGDETPTPEATATPLPPNWVTPVIIANTATPENAATAQWQAQIATAQAIVYGTPTPLPVNAWTATPNPEGFPEPTRDLVLWSEVTPTATPTVTPTGIPPVLRGKILFLSDRSGTEDGDLMVMNPDGSDVALWAAGSDSWIYRQAKDQQDVSPDGRFRVVVSEYKIDSFPDHKLSSYQLFVVPLLEEGQPQKLSQLTEIEAMSYDAVWSPVDYRIAFVATTGNDEIYTIRPDGSDLQRLTFNQWEWDKHPSWSPDGAKIVFWSNRDTARKQIWIMNADGSEQRNVSNNEFNDWDPVWVK